MSTIYYEVLIHTGLIGTINTIYYMALETMSRYIIDAIVKNRYIRID